MNGAKFLTYVKQCLAPTLKRKDNVVIDNLPAHKAAGIREAIEQRGATLRYLPQYSPDLNPIEMRSARSRPLCGRQRNAQSLVCAAELAGSPAR
jgi:transposase